MAQAPVVCPSISAAASTRDQGLLPGDVTVDAGEGAGVILDLVSPVGIVGVFFAAPLLGLEGPMGVIVSQFAGPGAFVGGDFVSDALGGIAGRVENNLSTLRIDGLGRVLAQVIQLVREQPLIAALFGVSQVSASLTGGGSGSLENAVAWPATTSAAAILETVHRGDLRNIAPIIGLLSRQPPGTCGSVDRCGCAGTDGLVEPLPECLEENGLGSSDACIAELLDASAACGTPPACEAPF